MGFWQWLMRADLEAEQRTREAEDFLTFEDVFGPDFRPNTPAGMTVDRATSFTLPAVYRCISLNAQTIASLPVDSFIKQGSRRQPYPAPEWLSQPNPEYDWMQFVQEVQTSLEVDGNAFILIVRSRNRVVELWHLAPHMVDVQRDPKDARRLRYVFDGGREVFTQADILHIKAYAHPRTLRGLSPIQACMATVGTGLAAQEFAARWFGTGAHPSGVIEVPQGVKLDPEQRDHIREEFAIRHGGVQKSHAVGILTAGAQWKPISVNAEEAQFLETQKYTASQIALLYGIPPNYVTDAEGTKGYVTGVLAAKEMWLQFGLLYRIVRLERSFSRLMPEENAYIKFNLRSFLRPEPQEQANMMVAEIQNGVRTINEWRALLDLDPIEGGDTPLRPLNMAPI